MSRTYRNRDLGLAQLGERALEVDPSLLEQRLFPEVNGLPGVSRSSRAVAIGRRIFNQTASLEDLRLAAALERLEADHAVKEYLRTFDLPRARRARRKPCCD